MPRYRLDVEYDGRPYAGWQRQDGHPTVQQAIETAIRAFSGEVVTIRGAGRTDAGVHATGQVAHVDLEREWRADKVRDAMNAHLKLAGEAVAITAAIAVDATFDARFRATARHYRYVIVNRRARSRWISDARGRCRVRSMPGRCRRPPFGSSGVTTFTTFRSVQCQAESPIRTLDRLDIVRTAGDRLEITASARSFLHNQVRSMVGTLKLAGEGLWTPDRVEEP